MARSEGGPDDERIGNCMGTTIMHRPRQDKAM